MKNILEYLERTAARTPGRTAFYDDKEALTFEGLLCASRRIGTALARTVPPRAPVALLMDARSIRNIPAIFGVLFAGGMYAPLDITMPPERLSIILGFLRPGAVLADEKGAKALSRLKEDGTPVLSYEEAAGTAADAALLDSVRRQTEPDDPASVLYTSGSTGIPKGSVQTHASYLHWTEATVRTYGFDEDVVFGNQSPFFYANSIIDIFPPVALGACVYLLPSGILNFPRKFAECLSAHKVTELTMTPSSFVGVSGAGVLSAGCLPALRWGIMSGESMPWEPLKVWMEATPAASWWHFYGSTEMFSVAVGKVEGKPAAGERLPVGRPFKEVCIAFLGEDGREAPEGTPGEMLLSSPWVAKEYYRDAQRTEAFWVTDPLGEGRGERFYRSGDLGYLRPDGQLVVLGRKDSMIKHRGYRMELGEVEAALLRVPGLWEGCVLFHEPTGKIWCFYAGGPAEKELKKALKASLSAYMLPDVLVKVETLPKTASMKVDRAGLRKRMEEE